MLSCARYTHCQSYYITSALYCQEFFWQKIQGYINNSVAIIYYPCASDTATARRFRSFELVKRGVATCGALDKAESF